MWHISKRRGRLVDRLHLRKIPGANKIENIREKNFSSFKNFKMKKQNFLSSSILVRAKELIAIVSQLSFKDTHRASMSETLKSCDWVEITVDHPLKSFYTTQQSSPYECEIRQKHASEFTVFKLSYVARERCKIVWQLIFFSLPMRDGGRNEINLTLSFNPIHEWIVHNVSCVYQRTVLES